MATITWPATLPQTFKRDSYEEEMVKNTIVSEFEVGPSGLRRRLTANVSMVTGELFMTTEQWENMLEFLVEETLDRSLCFGFPAQGYSDDSPAQEWLVFMKDPPSRSWLAEDFWLVTTNFVVLGTAGATSPLLIFVGTTDDTSDTDEYVFTNHAIGNPADDRLVIVAVHTDGAGNGVVAGVTVGGDAATEAVSAQYADANAAIFYRLVPTGTTATIVVNTAGVPPRCSIAVYRLVGHQSDTPVDINSHADSIDVHSLTVDLPARSVAVAVQSLGPPDILSAWTNATEKYDDNIGDESGTSKTGATVSSLTEQLGYNITSAHNSADGAAVVAVWS